ncbi:MAG: hypothetical protein JSR89_01210 [Proteobacteria bacterium]|nr:hypothetical protein [Pseudomonadota bacterium]
MRPWIKARFEPWKAALEFGKRELAAAGKARLFPNFVKSPWIAGVAPLEVHRADPKPTRDPNVDGVVLGQGTACDVLWWLIKKRNGHDNTAVF